MAIQATKYVLALMVIVLITEFPGLAVADISGPAKVIDCDTIKIGGVKIRLHGIDAPESAQVCKANEQTYRCGAQATQVLDASHWIIVDPPETS